MLNVIEWGSALINVDRNKIGGNHLVIAADFIEVVKCTTFIGWYQYSCQEVMPICSIGLLMNAFTYALARRALVSNGMLWSIAQRRMR